MFHFLRLRAEPGARPWPYVFRSSRFRVLALQAEPDIYTLEKTLAARACHDAKGRSRAVYQDLLEKAGLELKDARVFTDFGQVVIITKKALIANEAWIANDFDDRHA
jgi:hypothetical protein